HHPVPGGAVATARVPEQNGDFAHDVSASSDSARQPARLPSAPQPPPPAARRPPSHCEDHGAIGRDPRGLILVPEMLNRQTPVADFLDATQQAQIAGGNLSRTG
ncbi:hypothetical protein QUU90_22585, partial [Xanthomonas citri pv. citri]